MKILSVADFRFVSIFDRTESALVENNVHKRKSSYNIKVKHSNA
jgi:hypothetical protein